MKPILRHSHLIKLLRNRGLIINDKKKAIEILSKINYQRFSDYRFSFQNNNKYNSGVLFEDIYDIYLFDKKLRGLLLDIIENIEIGFRAKITYTLGLKIGEDFYLNNCYFENPFYHADFLRIVHKEINPHNQNVHTMIRNHQKKYTTSIPIYKIIELFSFGTLSKFYSNLLTVHRDLLVNNYYKKNNNKITEKHIVSWLKTLNILRNNCAHHSVLWDKPFIFPPREIKNNFWKAANQTSDFKKLFGVLMIFREILLDDVKFGEFINELDVLLSRHPKVNISLMGFPPNWKTLFI